MGPAIPSLIASCPRYLFLKSSKATKGTEGPSFLLTRTCPSLHGTSRTTAYLGTLLVQVHLQHPRKLRPLDASCLLHPKHFSSFRQANKHIWDTVRKKDWRKCQEVGSSFRVGKTPGLGSCGARKHSCSLKGAPVYYGLP